MTYKTEKAWGEYEINTILSREAHSGWKPIFITPVIRNEKTTDGKKYLVKEFLITFEKQNRTLWERIKLEFW